MLFFFFFHCPIHVFSPFPVCIPDEGAFLSLSLMCPLHLVNTMLQLAPTNSSSNWAPECLHEGQNLLYILSFPPPLHAFRVKTGTQQSQNKGPHRVGGCKVWKREILLCCRMNQVIVQVGWCFRVLEKHLFSRKMIASKCWLGGGGMRAEGEWGEPPAYCLILQRDCSFMKALYCCILGKLDLAWGIVAFLNSCVDR